MMSVTLRQAQTYIVVVMLSLSKHDVILLRYMKNYFVYILECSDKSYYTGVTNNLEKRLAEHNSGFVKGYTSTRLPVSLIYSTNFSDINEAIKFEKQLKGWSRKKKEALMRGDFDALVSLSKSKSQNDRVIGQSSTSSD